MTFRCKGQHSSQLSHTGQGLYVGFYHCHFSCYLVSRADPGPQELWSPGGNGQVHRLLSLGAAGCAGAENALKENMYRRGSLADRETTQRKNSKGAENEEGA